MRDQGAAGNAGGAPRRRDSGSTIGGESGVSDLPHAAGGVSEQLCYPTAGVTYTPAEVFAS